MICLYILIFIICLYILIFIICLYINFYNLFIYIINTAAFFQDFKLINSIEYFIFKIIQFIRR